jgi:beta-mannosidase
VALHRELHEGWTLRPAGDTGAVPAAIRVAAAELGALPARVPGCVHTDLMSAGLIPDPYLDTNENDVAWIGRTDWRYATVFDADTAGHERVDLVCEGLDTVATVSLNGVVVGTSANQHRSYRFDLRPALRDGSNELAVEFTSAYSYAEAMRTALGDRPGAYAEPYQFIRKMACNFGWDWGPTLVTAGIWRPIGLQAWSTARLDRVRPLVTVEPDGSGRVSVHVDVERSGVGPDVPLIVTARVGMQTTTVKIEAGESSAVVDVVVPDVELWWPRGFGGQPLYDLTVGLAAEEGEAALGQWQRRIGFRMVRLDTTPDEIGERFAIEVNGEPVFVKGANWIPDDCFPSRVDRARYAARLAQACEANLNLLRIWGGGIYESQDFYELCDSLGILVWQDFLFACAAYPEESPLAAEVEAEAREQVARLTAHPSLVLWNGNNENIEGYFSWGWQPRLEGRTWGEHYYLDVLPRVVSEVDPTRPYWPGSPYSGSMQRDPQDDRYGTRHLWDVWNRVDYAEYRSTRPRFAAEYGYQGPPNFATLRRAVADRPLRPDSPGVLHHQKADDGNGKLQRGLAYHFPVPNDFDDWHYLTQVNQARALTVGIEHLRTLWPTCTGSVVWQLNDCWPVTSWAMVDGDARLKPLWYAVRRAYADRLLTVQPDGDGLVAVAVNDCAKGWWSELRVTRRRLDGTVLVATELPISAAARGVLRVPIPAAVAAPTVPAEELLVVEADGIRALWFYAEDRDIAYPAPAYHASVASEPGAVSVTITARTLLRDLVLQVDRVDPSAIVDDAMITLLPGETATLRIRRSGQLDPDALVRAPVLRCVNEVVRRARTSVKVDV